jgi:hypothetical protein
MVQWSMNYFSWPMMSLIRLAFLLSLPRRRRRRRRQCWLLQLLREEVN